MKLLSAIHRWAGGLIGLLLALLGLTGAILLWEGEWIMLPGAQDPVLEDVVKIAAITQRAAADGELSRITVASEDIGLHQLVNGDGSGVYVRQDGEVIERWSTQWERPELWLFDLHHRLFAGETGETVTGIAGLAGVLFVVTGTLLWWRSRRAFAPRPWPKHLAPGPIVSHHRDLGILVAPLLLLSLTTGALMVFEPLRQTVIGKEVRPKAEVAAAAVNPSVGAMLAAAKARFPNALLRRISFPAKAGDPIVVRMRQPSEWTPNGRTQLAFDGSTGRLLSVEDAVLANGPASMSEKLYPLHSAKIGGLAMKLLMTLSGLALFVLGSLATYSFWARRAGRRRRLPGQSLRPGRAESASVAREQI